MSEINEDFDAASESEEERKRLAPSPATLRELYLYSGNICAFEPCTAALLLADGTLNFEVAHIHGVKKGAARGKHNLSNEELRDKSNLALLCLTHHNVVDNLDNEADYPISRVQKMKSDHEAKYRQAMANLDRMVDTSLQIDPLLPSNLYGVEELRDFDENDKVILESAADMEQFVANVAKQPVAVRDLILFILDKGEEMKNFGTERPAPISTSDIEIMGKTNISQPELFRWAHHLRAAGLLSMIEPDEDDSRYFFRLVNSGPKSGDWNIFNTLKEIAEKDPKKCREILVRAIIELDFTMFEGSRHDGG